MKRWFQRFWRWVGKVGDSLLAVNDLSIGLVLSFNPPGKVLIWLIVARILVKVGRCLIAIGKLKADLKKDDDEDDEPP